MKTAALLAILLAAAAPARAYKLHPCIQRSTGFSVSLKDPMDSAGVVDVAVSCHFADPDDSLIPKAWQGVIAPETWALQVSLGGDFHGAAVIAAGASANVAPMLATSVLHAVDENKPTAQGQVKAWLLGRGAAQFRLGGGLAPHIVYNGHFQSLPAAFPGRGFFDILGNIARLNVGLAW